MRQVYLISFSCFLAMLCVQAIGQTAPTTRESRVRPPQTVPSATQPVIQRGTANRHQQFLQVAQKGDIDLLFIGDSITDFWQSTAAGHAGKTVWDKYFAPLKAADFGINADRTQNVLWRLQNGELDGFKAKCIVLLLGTNNISGGTDIRNTNEQALEGMKLVINEIRQRQPQAKLILMGIFPRGRLPDDPFRAPVKAVNAELAKYDNGKNIFFVDIGDKFVAADGTIPTELMPDARALHPSEKGYEIWAQAIIGKVKDALGTP